MELSSEEVQRVDAGVIGMLAAGGRRGCGGGGGVMGRKDFVVKKEMSARLGLQLTSVFHSYSYIKYPSIATADPTLFVNVCIVSLL